jgi:hypothetical protein
MNDLIPIAVFVGCLLATFGLVRVCEWLRPATSAQRSRSGAASASSHQHEESIR